MQVKDREDLREAREQLQYSQRLLATICNCSQTTIYMLESGRMTGCSEDLAKIIAKRLGRTVRSLFIEHTGLGVTAVTTAPRRTRQLAKAG